MNLFRISCFRVSDFSLDGWDGIDGDGVNWQGLALYFRRQITPVFAFAPRWEFYDDKDGFVTGVPQTVQEITLTGEGKHSGGLIFRMEYRRDWSDEDYFIKDGAPTDNQNTFTFAFIIPFSSRQ